MQVYVELAILENFCMDFTLLYCAKVVCKNPAHVFRIAIAAVLGACVAIVVPLLNLGGALSVAVKLASGLIICAVSGKFKGLKAYIKLTSTFFAFTALLGGALIGIFSLAGIKYSAGGGYILSSVPIGIPFFGALTLIIAARAIALKLKKTDRTEAECTVFKGGKQTSMAGFFDSGNSVYYLGQPVCVIPRSAAQKIVDDKTLRAFVKIRTVAESSKLKVFTADRLEIKTGDKVISYTGVKIAISDRADKAILHPDYMRNSD